MLLYIKYSPNLGRCLLKSNLISRDKKKSQKLLDNFASHSFEKIRVDLISRMSLKAAENKAFLASFEWLLCRKFDLNRKSVISRFFAKFNLAKVNAIKASTLVMQKFQRSGRHRGGNVTEMLPFYSK